MPTASAEQSATPRRRPSLSSFLGRHRIPRPLSFRSSRPASARDASGSSSVAATPVEVSDDGAAAAPAAAPPPLPEAEPPAPAPAAAPPRVSSGTTPVPPATAREARLNQVVVDLTTPENDEVQNSALTRLASLIDEATIDEAQQLGECVRNFGALEALLNLLERPQTEQDALRIIGNLASNAVDPNAADTKRLLFEMGAFDKILQRIHSESGPTVVYALGSVQNMCARREFALHMQATGADTRLRHLLANSSNASARHFAQGRLSILEAVLSPPFGPDPRLEPRNSSSQSASTNSMPASPRSPRGYEAPPSARPPRLVSPGRRSHSTSPPRDAAGDAAPRPRLLDGTPLCAVCLDRPVNTALTPCFHAGFCNGCAVTISYNRFPCPICRGAVTGLQRIYL